MPGIFWQTPCPAGTLASRSHSTHKGMTGKQEASRARLRGMCAEGGAGMEGVREGFVEGGGLKVSIK